MCFLYYIYGHLADCQVCFRNLILLLNMEFNLDDLKHNIKFYRSLKKISQQDLAERSNISTSYIADIELGRRNPSLKTLLIIAEALEIEPYLLLMNPQKVDNDIIESYSKLLLDKIASDMMELKKQF